jgi:NADH:ubiquinone oxidoreductase subunit F (NADH-binding)/ferredoxin
MAGQTGLRGRGGAAFPVARKLRAVLDSASARGSGTAVLVNGAEGEPGSAKDEMLLCRSPYLVLSGALLVAEALGARDVVIGLVAGGPSARSVAAAIKAAPELRGRMRVAGLPGRFVSGEGGALVSAVNGRTPLPPGRKRRASDSGVGGLPTYLSNAETFAQLAVLSLLGPEGFASDGLPGEPGTVLLTVGGSAARPAVVEAPTGVPLGAVLDMCEVPPLGGVLVGGYHGMWLPAGAARDLPVSSRALGEAGGTLGAGVVLPLPEDTCPLGEAARIARYLAKESSGQCGPCKLGLPRLARAISAIADGSGAVEAMELARRAAAGVRGRGACSHPDGASRFVLSALDVFTEDLAAHLFRAGCGRPVRGVLPLGPDDGERVLEVDWTRCDGHGLCAHLVPELVQRDPQGYPAFLDMPVPFWLEREAKQAVEMCPALALRLTEAPAPEPLPALPAPAPEQITAGRLISG